MEKQPSPAWPEPHTTATGLWVHIPAGPAPWWATQLGRGSGTQLDAAGPGGEPPLSAGPASCLPSPLRGRVPCAYLYHRDDEGQRLPAARRGRDTEVSGLIATSAHQKPVGQALQDSGNHCCLNWRNRIRGKSRARRVPEITDAASSCDLQAGLHRSRTAPEPPGASGPGVMPQPSPLLKLDMGGAAHMATAELGPSSEL